MTNFRTAKWLVGIALVTCASTAIFAQTDNDEAVARHCKPYLEKYNGSETNLPAAAVAALKACHDVNACQTDALSSVSGCARKLNMLTNIAPPPDSVTASTKAATPVQPATTQSSASSAGVTATSDDSNDQYNGADASSQPVKQSTPQQAPQQQNNKKSTGINWF